MLIVSRRRQRPPSDTPAARRAREYRVRQLNDEIQLKVTVNRDDLVAALVGVGALDPTAAADRQGLEDALAHQIREWCAAWGERTL